MARYKFDQIAHYLNEKRMPTEADRETYIGLEHLDSGNLTVTRWGSDVDIKGQKLVMHKGDILFGRRNTYLKRAAIAPHDGLFSAHGMIWRPKEDVVDAGFFPFFVSSDYFMDEAIRISVGSLSPTINWRDLKELEFDLPDIDTQRKLSTLLWAMERAKTAYKNLIAKTDELVKSQFVEMFGDLENNPFEWDTMPLKNIVTNSNNGITRRGNDDNGSIVLRIVDLQDGFIDYSKVNRILLRDKEQSCKLVKDDLLFVRVNGNPDYVARSAVFTGYSEPVYHNDHIIRMHLDPAKANVGFIRGFMSSEGGRKQLRGNVKTSAGQYSISQDGIGSIQIYLPPMELQNEYVSFVEQTDKSKFAAQQALADLTATQKALMRQYLG